MRTRRGWCLAMLIALGAAACSSEDAPVTATDAGADTSVVDLCSTFTSTGEPCPTVSPRVCFAECATGGCSCVATAGGPRWKCVTDLSCVPDAGPVDFDARAGEPDADAADAADAGDAGDAADAASTDARADGPG